jgi:hypothetical protein
MQAFNSRDHLMARRCFFHGSDFDWLFAFGQVRRPHRLAGVELVFQRDDFGSDVTTGSCGLLEKRYWRRKRPSCQDEWTRGSPG